jgi:hypothetical protein
LIKLGGGCEKICHVQTQLLLIFVLTFTAS